MAQNLSGAEIKAWPGTLTPDVSEVEVMIHRGRIYTTNRKVECPPEPAGAHFAHIPIKGEESFPGSPLTTQRTKVFLCQASFLYLSDVEVCASFYQNGLEAGGFSICVAVGMSPDTTPCVSSLIGACSLNFLLG